MKRLEELRYKSVKILANLLLIVVALTCAYTVGRGLLIFALKLGLPVVITAWTFHVVGTILIGAIAILLCDIFYLKLKGWINKW